MGDWSANWQETFVNYAVSPRDALGLSVVHMRSDDELRTRDVAEATYTRLVARWNMPEAQANVWFLGGVGQVTGNDFAGAKSIGTPGLQVDYETTRFYVSGLARLYRAEGLNHDFFSARVGLSFYEADYDETQPWLVLEARRMNALSDSTEVTPMLRLVNKRYFLELGVSNASKVRANLMVVF